MIIVLYVVSVAFAVFLMFAVKIVPSATEYFVLAGGMCACDYNSLQYSGNIETG